MGTTRTTRSPRTRRATRSPSSTMSTNLPTDLCSNMSTILLPSAQKEVDSTFWDSVMALTSLRIICAYINTQLTQWFGTYLSSSLKKEIYFYTRCKYLFLKILPGTKDLQFHAHNAVLSGSLFLGNFFGTLQCLNLKLID